MIMKQSKFHTFRLKKTTLMLVLWLVAQNVAAQISGVVTDAYTGDTIASASVIYQGHHVAVSGDLEGRYTIERHNGWYLTFSAIGYERVRLLIDTQCEAEARNQDAAERGGEVEEKEVQPQRQPRR